VVALVEVAEFVVAQGGASALSAVDLDVLTPIREICHGGLLPPPPDLLESWVWRDFAN